MNSLKDKVAVATDVIYVILGASGNTGSIIADSLLSKGKKARVVGRDAGRLQRFVRKGAEAFTANVSDADELSKAFSGARAAYLMLPPAKSREDQERDSDAIAKAVKESGLPLAFTLLVLKHYYVAQWLVGESSEEESGNVFEARLIKARADCEEVDEILFSDLEKKCFHFS